MQFYSKKLLQPEKQPYAPGTILFQGNNGASGSVDFYPGVYYIRAQGGGGGGGNNAYSNGGGGGSGAGFEGYIRFLAEMPGTLVTAGTGGAGQTAGTATSIAGVLTLGGGLRGLENSIGKGGTLSWVNNNGGLYSVVSATVQRDGYDGVIPPNSATAVSGGNSVLTNSGGGLANAAATAPGAGGGGGYAWHRAGGAGMYGEILISYERLRP